MFAYCNNNPVKYSDPTGHAYKGINSQFNYNEYEHTYGGLRSINPSGLLVKHHVPNGTLAIGGSAGVFGGPGGTGSLLFAIDSDANVGAVLTAGLGGGLPSTGGGLVINYTTAPDIYSLNGLSTTTGGSINIFGMSIGVEYSIFNDSTDSSIHYDGWTIIISGKASFPVETHGYASTSKVSGFNLIDLFSR